MCLSWRADGVKPCPRLSCPSDAPLRTDVARRMACETESRPTSHSLFVSTVRKRRGASTRQTADTPFRSRGAFRPSFAGARRQQHEATERKPISIHAHCSPDARVCSWKPLPWSRHVLRRRRRMILRLVHFERFRATLYGGGDQRPICAPQEPPWKPDTALLHRDTSPRMHDKARSCRAITTRMDAELYPFDMLDVLVPVVGRCHQPQRRSMSHRERRAVQTIGQQNLRLQQIDQWQSGVVAIASAEHDQLVLVSLIQSERGAEIAKADPFPAVAETAPGCDAMEVAELDGSRQRPPTIRPYLANDTAIIAQLKSHHLWFPGKTVRKARQSETRKGSDRALARWQGHRA